MQTVVAHGAPRAALRPYVALVLGLAITASAMLVAHAYNDARDSGRFGRAVLETEDRIASRLETYVAMLLATRAMVVASNPDADSFRRFASRLELAQRYPGIQGIGITTRFPWSERAAVEARMRAQGFPSFRVWPTEERPEGHAIVLLEPRDARNVAAIGYDMFTEPKRRAAMERARDTGEPAVSTAVTLVQEIDEHKQAGFLLYVPMYAPGLPASSLEERRTALVGFVYAPFRADDLFVGIFGSEREPRIGFAVEDGAGGLLHRSAAPRDEQMTTKEIAIPGGTWKLRLWAMPSFDAGSLAWIVPIIGGAGALVSLLVFLLARTRARATPQLRLHAQILDSMTEGVSVSDQDGTILYTNPAEDRMFGYERGELIGKPVTVQNTYPPEENARIVREVIAQLRERGEWVGEFSNIKKDGTAFTTAARITALDLGDKPVWVCVQEDVTARKQIEAERAALLEREQASRRAAEDANRAKDDFLAMLGHELRNPLAPIVTALDLVRHRQGSALTPELEAIERQVRHLRRMVDDLLDLSAVARGKITLQRERHELAAIVRQAVEHAAPLLEGQRHELVFDVPERGLVVDGDETRLVQVFANLLTNAAKYTDPGGRIEIRADIHEGRIRVRVRDNGIGIEPADLERVFALFAQGERRVERSRGGLGIGLSLARSVVELHGGEISAASEGRGKGTEITVLLPRTHATASAPVARASTPAPVVKRKRALVVDDNTDAADLLGELLRTAGHEVQVAYDAPQALAITRHWHPDVAILDIGLPVMDGYELAAQLPKQPRPLLIALTGYGRDHDRTRSAQAGFDHHLVKPVSPKQLLALLDAS